RVERHARGQSRPFARVGAGRVLVHHAHVDVECEASAAQSPCVSPPAVEAIEPRAIVPEAAALEAGGEPRVETAPARPGKPQPPLPAAVAADRRARLAGPAAARAAPHGQAP